MKQELIAWEKEEKEKRDQEMALLQNQQVELIEPKAKSTPEKVKLKWEIIFGINILIRILR